MEIEPYVEEFRRQFELAAEAGGEGAAAVASRLIAPLDAAIRLMLLDVLGAAAQEITLEMAPGSVELRLRGREPGFVVTPQPPDLQDEKAKAAEVLWSTVAVESGNEGVLARINLRLPDRLKTRVEQAADSAGLSTNAWLVRAAATAVERNDAPRGHEQRAPTGAQHRQGWARWS